ncbi:MAG: hypothetical protein AB7F28_01575 [Candidatus Margulisiibacteriota bacterium]
MRIVLILAMIGFLLTWGSISFAQEINQPPNPTFAIDPALKYTMQGMRGIRTAYAMNVLYTTNTDVPGYIETYTYVSRIKNNLQIEPYYKWGRVSRLQETNRPLDIYIDADARGFLQIQLPFAIGYTRDGRMTLGENNQLVTLAGHYPILGEEGFIFLPPGDIAISKSGVIFVNGNRIAKLKIAVMPKSSLGRMIGINGVVFIANGPDDLALLKDETLYGIRQGFYEDSTVMKEAAGESMFNQQSWMAMLKAVKTLNKTMRSSAHLGSE